MPRCLLGLAACSCWHYGGVKLKLVRLDQSDLPLPAPHFRLVSCSPTSHRAGLDLYVNAQTRSRQRCFDLSKNLKYDLPKSRRSSTTFKFTQPRGACASPTGPGLVLLIL
eukprot:754191-Hanusia_phi.AAC.5